MNIADHYDELLIERARMDKYFSILLDENDLDEQPTNSPAWLTYKSKLTDYSLLNLRIRSIEMKIKGKLK